ncbi:hypothetical protein [Streptomyces sp. NRRL F-2799]|uniref:hypothetical protein n=1 Tax=Streptomyces sp. NRRL F-2799 TaxID=1463844 RepID=UPI0004CBDC13|nr:hypothetical protein [Streptomyces sp. NRRL F-2799]
MVADVTRDELVEIVGRVLAAAPDSDHYLRLLKANTPHPRVSDLAFHSPGAHAEQIVEEALNHRGFAL